MPEVSELIGKKIRTFRKMRRMTHTQLAAVIGRTQSTVCKYETGEIALDVTTLYAIAQALQVPPQQLLYTPERAKTPVADVPVPAFSAA